MIRRLNYTSRMRIPKSDAIIVFDETTKPLSFNAEINLGSYFFQPTAKVFVEAYRGNSFMRVVLGIFRKFKFSAFLQFQNQRLMSL